MFRLGVVLVLFGALAAPGVSAWADVDLSKSRLFAVVVGVARYRDPDIPSLTMSAKDAHDFSQLLQESKGLFAGAYITVLLDEQATRDKITEALRNGLRPAGKDDVVIIYLSGHGAPDPATPNEFYFLPYDARPGNLFGTAVMMNDAKLFKGLDSEQVLFITDACHSGGFAGGLTGAKTAAASRFLGLFQNLRGRCALTSCKPDEMSFEVPAYGNSAFTHFVLKGLKGQADTSGDGTISAGELHKYIYDGTLRVTKGKQHPQIFSPLGRKDDTAVFRTATYSEELRIDVNFEAWRKGGAVESLRDGDTLRSGDGVGISFMPRSDCYVHILWWDSTGNMGRLFPNPKLTDGDGSAKSGKTYWLPSRGSEASRNRWFVLDDNPGVETIYFVASRNRNEKLEELYREISRLNHDARMGKKGTTIRSEMERRINLMGFAKWTLIRKSAGLSADETRALGQEMKHKIEISGADAVHRVRFKHVAR